MNLAQQEEIVAYAKRWAHRYCHGALARIHPSDLVSAVGLWVTRAKDSVVQDTRAYASTMLRHAAADLARRQPVEYLVDRRDDRLARARDPEGLVDPAPGPLTQLLARECAEQRASMVRQAWTLLSNDDRSLLLAVAHGASYRSLCDGTERDRIRLKTRACRARTKIRQAVLAMEDDHCE